MSADRIAKLQQAFAQRGFTQQFDVAGYEFTGELKVGELRVPVRLVYKDREFTRLPSIKIDPGYQLPRAVVPHVDEAGSVCFLDSRQFSVDRHDAAAQALSFLDRATATLLSGLRDPPEAAIAEELVPVWANTTFDAAFGNREGFAKAVFVFVRFEQTDKADEANAFCAVTHVRLTFTATQKRPDTFGEFIDWFRHWDAAAADRLLAGLKKLTAENPFAIISAPNGTVAVQIRVSARGQVKALERRSAWSRALDGSVARAFPVKRYGGVRADMDHVLGRNGKNSVAPLSGKRVLLVGCGSIGGFLARGLAQFGAGLGDGELILVDPETLSVANTGRHLLGAEHANKEKAGACCARILADLPGLNVRPVHGTINERKHLFTGADVVIDATGEEAVSEMLSEWRMELRRSGPAAPALIHVWLEGQGAAARSFLNEAPEGACYRCLEPVRGDPNHKALRPEAARELVGTCGDLPFTPYGPSSPMIAAGLAAQQAADWATENREYPLRTLRVDFTNTYESKPTTPGKSPKCPACKDQP